MSAAYGEPDWATPGSAATSGVPAEVSSAAAVPVNTGVGNKALTKDRSKLWHRIISITLIGLCALMIALGVFVIMDNKTFNEFAEWFIGAYMVLFAGLLFIYEAVWWCTIGTLNRVIRKNFGFMYKIRGKALYLIFVACLCIGINKDLLGDMDWLRWFAGIGWGVAGAGLLFVSFTKPDLFENYYVPTRGFNNGSSADDEMSETV